MLSSLPSMAICFWSLVSASKCTVQFEASRLATFNGAAFGPGLMAPSMVLEFHFMYSKMGIFWPAAGCHSPCQDPVSGCPSCAQTVTAIPSAAKRHSQETDRLRITPHVRKQSHFIRRQAQTQGTKREDIAIATRF